MKRQYSFIEKEIINRDLTNVLNQLWNIARSKKQEICGIWFNPNDGDGGLWMKMLSFQNIKGVWFEGYSIECNEYINILTNNTCNVLFINQKILNAKPSVELIECGDIQLII